MLVVYIYPAEDYSYVFCQKTVLHPSPIALQCSTRKGHGLPEEAVMNGGDRTDQKIDEVWCIAIYIETDIQPPD